MQENGKNTAGVFGAERDRCSEATSLLDGEKENSIFRSRFGRGLDLPVCTADVVIYVLYAILAIAVVLGIVFWDRFGDMLFFSFLFPVLTIGGQVILIVAVLALVGLYLGARLDFARYRHKWF